MDASALRSQQCSGIAFLISCGRVCGRSPFLARQTRGCAPRRMGGACSDPGSSACDHFDKSDAVGSATPRESLRRAAALDPHLQREGRGRREGVHILRRAIGFLHRKRTPDHRPAPAWCRRRAGPLRSARAVPGEDGGGARDLHTG